MQLDFGGQWQASDPSGPLIDAAHATLRAAAALGYTDHAYARIDGIAVGGQFLLMELEMVEPYLALRLAPQAADRLARAIADRIGPQRLFSYGTLQRPEMQRETFGRPVTGDSDALPGFREELLEITHPDVIRASGTTHHPIVVRTGDPTHVVQGTAFTITASELRRADKYEVDDYARIRVTLQSGADAWVYVAASTASTP